MKQICTFFLVCQSVLFFGQIPELDNYNQIWTAQSQNSSESMPLGAGDVGLNVWVEKGHVYAYMSKSDTFDEHNTLLKLGRIKFDLYPNPFTDTGDFKQELHLKDGSISISQNDTKILFWVEVNRPVIHVEVASKHNTQLEIGYESWRYQNRDVLGKANNANSYKWAPQGDIITYADSIKLNSDNILFYHKNRSQTVFDVTVKQQKLEAVKDQLMNPISNLTFGGKIRGDHLSANGTYSGIYQNTDFHGYRLKSKKAKPNHRVEIILHTQQTEDVSDWKKALEDVANTNKNIKKIRKETQDWWHQFWNRSFIYLDNSETKEKDSVYQIGQNYQLFRYMLACNAYGTYPTKFNGGLFTVDPIHTDSSLTFTPDFRNWGGGTMTAQNQRLVYFPMLKSGDFDMMPAQFDTYLRMLSNAELRTKYYWGHSGASFTEQIENFGLPNPSEYGWKRPESYDPGMQYNAWLEYQWDTSLEFGKMMLDRHDFNGDEIKPYLPYIMSCLRFFDEHYQYLATKRGRKTLDAHGDLVLYPGSSAETYKMAYNSTSTIAALRGIVKSMLDLSEEQLHIEEREYLEALAERIPPIELTSFEGKEAIAPAKLWERINNTETPQLYPVFPWRMYGVGKPDLQTAINTYNLDPDAQIFRSHIGWKQDVIFAAELGLTNEAARLIKLKLANSIRRFPAFWGPGFDWVPDHNWGGSGMIGLQEMLLQTSGDKILLFPAWPKSWNVHFKLHLPGNTQVEVMYKDQKLKILNVVPKERESDIVNYLNVPLDKKHKTNF